jgi:isopropylmalate/homocitrate/citramalate synthase
MSGIWTGEINRPHAFGAEVGFYDTTLRDGEQTVGVVLGAEQKLEIARALADAGVERIEAGFPRVSDADREAVRLIAAAGLSAEIWGFARAVRPDVEAVAELGLRATVIESPISELKLEALGVSREEMLRRIRDAVAFASARGITVAYFGVDGTRADPDFFDQAYEAAVEAGAQEVVVVDTLGVASPEAVGDLVARTRARLGAEIPVHFHGHNDFGLATAAAVAAARAGARWIHGTVNGMGERAGNANLGEIALALRALYGVETALRLDRSRALSERVRELSGYGLEPWKPLVGENLFRRESGAVASQFHDPPSIEPYSSELVGAERGIVLGKKSGLDSVRIKAEELGLDLDDATRRELLAAVKALGERERRLVTDEEFLALARKLVPEPERSRDAAPEHEST